VNIITDAFFTQPALQIAPYDMDYKWPNATGTYDLGTRWASELNDYRGGIYQQV
jgi:hypothetical protein